LKGYDLEDFIADLLQAMGYRTIVSAHGGDAPEVKVSWWKKPIGQMFYWIGKLAGSMKSMTVTYRK